jgi:hypothetical protein
VRTGPTPTQSATGIEANHNQQTIKPKSYQTVRICREIEKKTTNSTTKNHQPPPQGRWWWLKQYNLQTAKKERKQRTKTQIQSKQSENL